MDLVPENSERDASTETKPSAAINGSAGVGEKRQGFLKSALSRLLHGRADKAVFPPEGVFTRSTGEFTPKTPDELKLLYPNGEPAEETDISGQTAEAKKPGNLKEALGNFFTKMFRFLGQKRVEAGEAVVYLSDKEGGKNVVLDKGLAVAAENVLGLGEKAAGMLAKRLGSQGLQPAGGEQ